MLTRGILNNATSAGGASADSLFGGVASFCGHISAGEIMSKDRLEQDALSIDLDDYLDMDAFDWGNALDPVNIDWGEGFDPDAFDWGFSAAMPERTGGKQGKALAVNTAEKQQKADWPVLVKTHVFKQSKR